VQEQTGRAVQPMGSLAIPMAEQQGGSEPLGVYVPQAGCPATPPTADSADDMRCALWQTGGVQLEDWSGRGAVVAEPDTLQQLGYHISEAQQAVLAKSGVLLPNADLVHDGTATVTVYRTTDQGAPTDVSTVTVPAGYLPPRQSTRSPEYVDLVLTPEAAEAHHLSWVRDAGVLLADDIAEPLSTSEQDRLEETLSGITSNVEVYTERGFVNDLSLPLLGLALVGGLAVLIGTLTATGLALADSRPDLATLAAIGARPRTRRVMAAAQALVIGLLGAVTGVLVGLVPGIAVTWPLTSTTWSSGGSGPHGPTIAIPWLLLAAVGVAVPVIAALFAGTVVRSRLPLTRRLGQ
jgi:putative ABC transport system permease protein